jgi:hypothetical protein
MSYVASTANADDTCKHYSTDLCGIKKGQKAPFTGVLFSFKEAAKAAALPVELLEKCDLDKKELEGRLRLKYKRQINLLSLDIDELSQTAVALERELRKAIKPPAWYEQPITWAIIGFGVGVAATIGITHAVNSR